MASSKLRQALESDPSAVVATFGIATALLYAAGYVAEKVHWNRLGQAEAPIEQVAFLYRGGLVALSCLAEMLLYLLTSVIASPVRLTLLAVLALLLVSDRLKRRWEDERGWREKLLRHSAVLPWIGAALVAVLGSIELARWPETGNDLLLAGGAPGTPDPSFFRGYVGFLGILLGYLWLSSPERWKWAGRRKEETALRRFLGVAAAFLLILLPAVYGSFKYPLRYPIVVLHPMDTESLLQAPAALLGETEQELFLCRRTGEAGSIFRVRREKVKAIEVLRIGNILDPESFDPPEETSHEAPATDHLQAPPAVDRVDGRSPRPVAGGGAASGNPGGSPPL